MRSVSAVIEAPSFHRPAEGAGMLEEEADDNVGPRGRKAA